MNSFHADSGWQMVFAHDINDAGQIVGQGLIDGEMHAFVLTPVRASCPRGASQASASSPELRYRMDDGAFDDLARVAATGSRRGLPPGARELSWRGF